MRLSVNKITLPEKRFRNIIIRLDEILNNWLNMLQATIKYVF